jgi:protein-S-isoprenylcysteine O-methyltransferase Ste14
MKNLNTKAFGGLTFLFAVMVVLVFLSAGTINYWQGWIFLGVFFISALWITLYLMKHDPKLLEKRVEAGPIAEKQTKQKIIQSLASIGFTAMLVVPGFDHRFQWSSVSTPLEILGEILVAVGFFIIFKVFKENSFSSATIEVDKTQKVVSTGLYALVRHPMYMGAFFLFIGMSLGLGSWWDLVVYLLIMPALIWRLFEEEKYLKKNLKGYGEYTKQVKYHLIPFIW